VSPTRKREVVGYLQRRHGLSQRQACALVDQPRSTQRYQARVDADERRVVARMRSLAVDHPRFGYRRIAAELRREGVEVNAKRVLRLWRQEGLRVGRPGRKRRRLGQGANGCRRLRAERRNHVWSVDFVADRTEDGRAIRILVVLDEWTRECLALKVARSLVGGDVREVLRGVIAVQGAPEHVRSDNGPEFVSRGLRKGIEALGASSAYIEPGSPWQNGYAESFIGKLRDECLGRESFGSIEEARVLIEAWRVEYNERRPHSALGYRTPAEFAAGSKAPGFKSGTARPVPCSRPQVQSLSPAGT
jgi:putative transposase